jgi:hypothetical protein
VSRVILVGPPRAGKSTYARKLRQSGVPTYCTDPRSLCKEPEDGVTYLPEKYAAPDRWSAGSLYVAENWIPLPGPYCIDGVATVRALRKLLDRGLSLPPGVKVIRFTKQFEHAVTAEGQRTMAKGVSSIWREVERRLESVTEYR